MASFRLARLSPIADHVEPFRRASPFRGSPFPTMPRIFAEMDHMVTDMLSTRDPNARPGHLEAEDREFLARTPPQERQQAEQPPQKQQEDSPCVPLRSWSSSSFSSFSCNGDASIQTTTERVYDSHTGEIREVRRRSVGDQLVVEHSVHQDNEDGGAAEISRTRRLHNIDEAQMADFERHFSPAKSADHQAIETPQAAPPPPPLTVSPEDVAALHRVMPELSPKDATELLRQHDGNLREAIRASLQE